MKNAKYMLVLMAGMVAGSIAQAEDGAAIFKSKCTSCHSIGKGVVVGPDLKNVHSRYDEKWLSSWIRGSQKMVQSGDKAAVAAFEKNNKIPMPDQDLNDADMSSLLAFIKSESEKPAPAPVATTAPIQQPGVAAEPSSSFDPGSVFFYIGIGFISFFVIAAVWSLGLVINKLSNSLEAAYAEINQLKGKK